MAAKEVVSGGRSGKCGGRGVREKEGRGKGLAGDDGRW